VFIRKGDVITFNDILRAGGLDPDRARVKMLRHTLTAQKRGRRQILELWRSDRALVEAYQARQNDDFFVGTSYVACFLVSRSGATVFGGLYRVDGSVPAALGELDPITGDPNLGRRHIWDLARLQEFSPYEDRLVVDWGPGGLAWAQWAHRQPKPVLEIATQREADFPGWRGFTCTADELAVLPAGWRGALAANRGVYLLVDLDAGGKQYIGSAKGGENLLGRLQGYAEGGTNGNLGLTRGHRYQVAVLEVVGTGESDLTIEKIESQWKDKLRTREYGLNRN
jgi:hypothetical protein